MIATVEHQPAETATAADIPERQAVCRFCGTPLQHTFVDLGMSPLCESYVPADRLNAMEPFYPLHVYVCENCFLVQLEQYVGPESIFRDYAYFSSYSESWVQHAHRYVDTIAERLGLGPRSLVIEAASNDGYLLQWFLPKGIPVLGVEPARNVAAVAVEKGVPTIAEFFGVTLASRLAAEGRRADLIVGNNVLAQVPDLHDFVGGLKIALKPHGVITMEFPHLARLMQRNQLDTIYHEHFSYFSFATAERIFAAHDLTLFDVEELPTHGGSLRIYACHADDDGRPIGDAVLAMRQREEAEGFLKLPHYCAFDAKARNVKFTLLEFLLNAKRRGCTVVGYGAPGKGNTLLNYCGIRTDFLDYTVDRSPHKQGKFLPGTHIPICHPDRIRETRPEYVLILPWNIKEEIIQQMGFIRTWGGRFVVPIPEVTVYA